MSDVIDKAVRDRERPLREDVVVPFRSGYVRLRADDTVRIVKQARRRFRRHNAARRWVESEVWSAMAATWRGGDVSGARGPRRRCAACPRCAPRSTACGRCSRRPSCCTTCSGRWGCCAWRPRRARRVRVQGAVPPACRVGRATCGGRPPTWRCSTTRARCSVRSRRRSGKPDEGDEIRTYGHIVIDEVQDLTPMQLRMAARRSLNGSMTVVGDIAQATGPLAPDDWDDVLAHLPDASRARVIGLSVGYRIPAQMMELANRVMAAATPGSGRRRRSASATPRRGSCASTRWSPASVDEVRTMIAARPGAGGLAVVVPDERCDEISAALNAAGIEHGRAATTGLDESVTVVPVSVVKGLELDGVVVVEPSEIVGRRARPARPVRGADAQHPAAHRRPPRRPPAERDGRLVAGTGLRPGSACSLHLG